MAQTLLTPEASASSVPQAPARKPALPALTGVRTLLAVNIMLFHFTPPHMQLLYPVINNSYVFVGFFFLLSGYVLAYNYADRETPLSKRQFWKARFARLYPLYAFSLVFSALMVGQEWHARSQGEFFAGMVLTPLMLQAWDPWLATFWNTVAWTLSCDLLLYLLFPYLLRLPWPKQPLKLVGLCLAIWAVGLIPHTIYLFTNPDHLPGPADRYSYGFWTRALKYGPPAYVCTFVVGIALGKLQACMRLTHRQRTAVAVASLAAIGLFFAYVVDRIPYILMHGGFLVPLFGALVIGLSGRNFVASAFAWKPIELLGQCSYCLFLLHFNLINMIREYHVPEKLHLAAYDPWFSYAVAIGLSVATMYWVEKPARRWILGQREPKLAAVTTP
jgi:peptidoglycan/LPS O-acetylase OafA/YrhL